MSLFGRIDTMKSSLESVSKKVESSASAGEYIEGSLEEIKDTLFGEYMKQQLLEDFFNELDGYIDKDDSDKMRSALAECDDDVVYGTLSLPAELRERKFLDFQKKLENNQKTAEELINDLISVSTRYGFSIGYHTSPSDIRPDEKGRWSIKGTEKDHRDDDRTMAYYSSKYRHLFKKKGPKFVYIVRTEPETHKTDGNWSRASELSIVAKVPFEEVFNYVEKTSRDIEKQEGAAK